MGTPEFAVATLGSLVMNGFNVLAVVTAPDKPSGRGQKLSCSAVKKYALDNKLPVLQPQNLKDPEFISTLKSYNPDLFIVVAFRMLPGVVWNLPPAGTINLHASLLPDYRGAAPINHVIINGETTTGVTTFFINDKIDTGNILLREEVNINPGENAGELHDRLMVTGARLVIKTLKGLSDKALVPRTQSEFMQVGKTPKEAPKIFPEDCFIKWDNTAATIHNLIRGLSPYPCARTIIHNADNRFIVKISESLIITEKHNLNPGTILTDGKHYIRIAANDGFIEITDLQLEGKKRMTTAEFLRGFNISSYTIPLT